MKTIDKEYKDAEKIKIEEIQVEESKDQQQNIKPIN